MRQEQLHAKCEAHGPGRAVLALCTPPCGRAAESHLWVRDYACSRPRSLFLALGRRACAPCRFGATRDRTGCSSIKVVCATYVLFSLITTVAEPVHHVPQADQTCFAVHTRQERDARAQRHGHTVNHRTTMISSMPRCNQFKHPPNASHRESVATEVDLIAMILPRVLLPASP